MSKVAITITVDKDVLEAFKKLCEENDSKVSTKLNSLMREWVSKNGG